MPVTAFDFVLNIPDSSSWNPVRYEKISVRSQLDGSFHSFGCIEARFTECKEHKRL